MTPQGRAIKEAAVKFGDGKTLPFAPCKKGYIPMTVVVVDSNNNNKCNNNKYNNNNNKYNNNNNKTTKCFVACSFHEKARRTRLAREKGILRGGEADPKTLFWDKAEQDGICKQQTK